METQKSLKKNALLNSFKTFVTLFFPLITFPYSTRILGPMNIGKVNFSQSIASYFTMIAALGVWSYAVREAAKVRDDKKKLNQFAAEILTITMTSTAISYILLFIAIFTVPKFADYRTLIIISSTLIFFNTLGIDWLYAAMEDYLYITVRSIAFQIISLTLLFVLVKKESDYLFYAAINVISNSGANILNFIHSRKYVSFKGVEKLQIKKHLKPIFTLFAFSIASSVFTTLDTSMIGFLSNDIQVGYYSAGVKIVKMLRNLFPAFYSVLFARLAYYYQNKNEEGIQDISRNTMNFNMCFGIPISTGLALLIDTLTTIFCGQKYMDAIDISRTMCPFIILSACSGFLGGGILIAYSKEKIELLAIILASAIDFVLNLIFIPKHGALGAAFSTLITEAFILFFYIIYLHSFIKKLKLLKPLVQYVAATAIMSVIVWKTKTIVSNPVPQLIISTAAGIFTYGAVLLLMQNKYVIEQAKIITEKIKRKIKK